MKHLATLSLLLLLAAAAANAQQTFNPPAGMDYALLSTAPATADGEVSYQWYRNGEAIAGATAETYTVPAAEAHGANVEFKRQAAVDGSCSGARQVFSNAVTVNFEEEFPLLTVGGVTWAATNVDAQGTFAARPDDYGMFYQWNRNTAWANSGTATDWNSTLDQAATWTVSPLPCPAGWELPSRDDFRALEIAGGGSGSNGSNAGSTWVAANEKGNAVAGRFFGPNHASCSFSGSMSDCLFFPASGRRSNGSNPSNQGANGYYWSSTQYNVNSGSCLVFDSSSTSPLEFFGKAYAYNVRCVQK